MKPALLIFSLLIFGTARGTDLPDLPVPMSNNAVASLRVDGETFVLSALGLGTGKTWRDTLSSAYLLRVGDKAWKRIPDVPGAAGRLAAVAVAARGKFYVFGGYTVAEDGSEISIESVHELDPRNPEWQAKAPMPVPVDDTVAVVYQDRFIYLISGWHDLGNVNLVQAYDLATDSWVQATPFPGTPVFGHAGGIAGSSIVTCDGVKISVGTSGPREFAMSNECFRGDIDGNDPRRIDWHAIPPHPGRPHYRMAATGAGDQVVFLGGSENPYNYDGIGYDGEASHADHNRYVFSVAKNSWQPVAAKVFDPPTMDHRGLLRIQPRDQSAAKFCVVGGMRNSQEVSAEINCWTH